jgi:lipoprotein-anchoring transpeptidase ErfK/SrfK
VTLQRANDHGDCQQRVHFEILYRSVLDHCGGIEPTKFVPYLETVMSTKVFAAGIGLALYLSSVPIAGAQYGDERMDLLGGGSPRGRSFNFLGGSELSRSRVSVAANYKPGTIVINTAERRLYLIQGNGTALRYAIGVGRVGFTWKGVRKVTAKKEWPGWTPPPQMRKRARGLPAYMAGGIDNPLGARALYLGGTLYRIHGSNEPETIGQAVSSGCFRMTNEDIADLYNRVAIGTTVTVQ